MSMRKRYKVIVHVSGPRFDEFMISADSVVIKDGYMEFRLLDWVEATVSMQHLIHMRVVADLSPPLDAVTGLPSPASRRDPIGDAARDAASRLVLPVTAPSQVRYEKYDLAQGGVIPSSAAATEGELGPNW